MSGTREQRRNGAAFQWANDVQKLAEGDTIKGGFRLCRCEQLLCVRACGQTADLHPWRTHVWGNK